MPYDLFACSFLREERGRRLRYREQRRAKSLRANYNRRLNELKKFVSAAKFIPATTSFEETLGKWHQLKQFQMSLMRSSNNHNEETIRNEEKNTPTRTPKVSLVKKNGNNPSTIEETNTSTRTPKESLVKNKGNNPSTIEETNTSTRTPKESLVKNKGNSPSTIEDELDLYYRHGEEMEGHHRMGWMRSDASSSGLFEFMKFHENRFRDIIWRKLAAKVEKHRMKLRWAQYWNKLTSLPFSLLWGWSSKCRASLHAHEEKQRKDDWFEIEETWKNLQFYEDVQEKARHLRSDRCYGTIENEVVLKDEDEVQCV